MLQYIVNLSAIWLLGLALFDIFLRRENYHGYNRFYLLFTLLLGALLPLVQWGSASYTGVLRDPVARTVAAKQTLISAAAPAAATGWDQWLAMIYSAGVLAALCVLAADVVKLVRYSRSGTRSGSGGWVLVETGREHAPFSFCNTLFVNSRQQYSSDEWQMIIEHEQRHNSLFHFADLLFIHVARIIFWFHPLVYVYKSRLLLVHEYQADGAAAQQPQVYGRFLVEQAVLHAAPSLSHSFNRSPIKNRIVMLTRKSSVASRSKMLVLLPLVVIAAGFFTKDSLAKGAQFVKKGNTVTYKGNKFTLAEPRFDTIVMIDPVSGEEITRVSKTLPEPIAMNGKKIYYANEVTSVPQRTAKALSIEDNILMNLATDMKTMADGVYRIDMGNVIVDEHGKVVYYEYGGIEGQDKNGKQIKLTTDVKKKLDDRITMLIETSPQMKPASLNGANVVINTGINMYENKIEVTNHVPTFSKSFK